MPKRNIVWLLIGAVVVVLLLKAPESIVRRDQLYTQFGPLLDVRVQVRKHYVEEVDDAALLRGAIDGMLNRLDPYTMYFDEQEYEQFHQRTQGQFSGIGIEVGQGRSGGLVVISPIEGSPAFHAGLRAGDRITRIDGRDTSNMSLAQGVRLIQGRAGTSVTLTIYRPATDTTAEKVITRGLVTVRTVRGWARDDKWRWDYLIDPEHRIGYIRISGFEAQTAEQFDEALTELRSRQDLAALVIDVRDNPGGLLDVVSSIVNRFIAEGVIVSTRGRFSPEKVYTATRDEKYPPFPLAVLVNGGSASAAEILAGALQDHGRAVVVGEPTFGKGSVQELIQLENNNGAVKLTTAYYYLPKGERIHGRGIQPDVLVELSPRERAMLVDSQQAVYSTTHTPPSGPEGGPPQAPGPSTATATDTAPAARTPAAAIPIDRQLAEALAVLRQRLATQPS